MVGDLPSGYNPFAVGAMGAGGPSKGVFGGILPDADVSGGFQLMVVGIGKNPLNTPLASFINGGGYGRKPGQQALLSKIAAQISADFQQAKNAGDAYKAQLAAGVEAAAQHGLPRDVGTKPNGGSNGRSA